MSPCPFPTTITTTPRAPPYITHTDTNKGVTDTNKSVTDTYKGVRYEKFIPDRNISYSSCYTKHEKKIGGKNFLCQ